MISRSWPPKVRPRLLFAVHSAQRGGAELSALAAAEHLAEHFELIIAVPDGPLRERFGECGALVPGPALLPIWCMRPGRWLRSAARTVMDTSRIVALIRRSRVDAIVANTSATLSPVLAARIARVPALVHIRDYPQTSAVTAVYAAHAALADTVVPVSAFVQAFLPPRPRARVVVIPDGVEVPAAAPPLPGGERLKIIAIGPLEPHKGQDTAVESLGELLRRGIDAELELVGREQVPAFVERLRTRAAELGITDRVRMTGALADVAPALARADVLVAPSNGETLGLTALEASAHGRPVVASRVGGLVESVQHGKTGLLVTPGDSRALADALASIARDPMVARSLGAVGRAHVAERYARRRSVERVESEIRRLLPAAN